MAANLDPEDFANAVRFFQGICTSVVTQWGGAIGHSVGDEALALFGYPTSHEDDAERAVHAGLDLVARVGELSFPSGEPLQVRTAIATGLVFIGENRTAIGEAIIMADQLGAMMPPNSVNVSASTREHLGGVFVCDDPQRCELEGVSKPVTWYRVTGKGAVQTRFDAQSWGSIHSLWDGNMNCSRCRPSGNAPRVARVKSCFFVVRLALVSPVSARLG